ncbi:BRISC and BRCA1-A complex member 1 [Dufourea novaeangliae]|uniref:BRISC and BRCA1-A complex member 1 n=1 Tax=Dufourea novaeangliae TaxID=178035 RepID=A0A154PCV1_DUFNO|nr:BRISC and BRCA1-A complex member 1 [Dufourea novaeangliae]
MNNLSSVAGFLPDVRSTLSDENNAFFRNLSGINLPEKILFVIDTVRETNCTPFKLSTGAKYMPLFMMKRVVENFVCIKSTIQRKHEYAIMTLNGDSANWICDFTNNTKNIVDHLDAIDEDFQEEERNAYDLGQLFEKIQSKLPMPPKKHSTLIPTFITRVILMYSRSNSIPKFDTTKLDTANYSYILEVGKNAAKLHDNMAKLLAHPLQRPSQKDVCYTIYSPPSIQETHTNV